MNTLTKYLAGVATVVAITGGSVFTLWDTVGWITPGRHGVDLEGIRQEFVIASNKADEETRQFRTEWRCSEMAEDLEKLYEKLRAGDDSQRLRDRIEGLRKRMDDSKCDRYEDY